MAKLNLGCGETVLPGYLGVDINPYFKPDVLHDLNEYPYPFTDDEFEEVLARHIIEHLDEPGQFLVEVYRITKPGGKITIMTPHYSNVHSFSDFTHKWHLSTYSFAPKHVECFFRIKYTQEVSIKLRGWLWKIVGIQFLINHFEGFRWFWEKHLSFIIRATEMKVVITSRK